MCTVLGWVQGWWSVTGLAVEIAGFAVLSLDVAREYGRHRTVERYRAGAAAAQREVEAKSEYSDKDEIADHPNELAELERGLRRDIKQQRQRIDRFTAKLAWSESLLNEGHDKHDFHSRNFAEIAAELPIKADRIAARPYRRAPIRFGILLVLLGAMLQMVGSWPCT
jgi:hypothetical protein